MRASPDEAIGEQARRHFGPAMGRGRKHFPKWRDVYGAHAHSRFHACGYRLS
jgi:hypothetical protein